MLLEPNIKYWAPDVEESITPGAGPHQTDGSTTQISDVVVKAGGEDRDRPSPPNNSQLGDLRAKLTTLQDKLNVFLTDRMKVAKELDTLDYNHDIERRILDDGVDEDESD